LLRKTACIESCHHKDAFNLVSWLKAEHWLNSNFIDTSSLMRVLQSFEILLCVAKVNVIPWWEYAALA